MIGVVSSSKVRASALIDELGLLNARAFANNPRSTRGIRLDAVLIDGDAEVSAETQATIECAVSNGRVYRLERA